MKYTLLILNEIEMVIFPFRALSSDFLNLVLLNVNLKNPTYKLQHILLPFPRVLSIIQDLEKHLNFPYPHFIKYIYIMKYI
jgi:hypothetical protein